MEKFLLRACAELKIQENNLMEAKKRFSQCCVFFTVRAKSADSSVSPCDFFSLWMPFAADFKDLWKREQQRMVMKRIERAQKRVKEIQEERKKSVVSNTSPKSKKGLMSALFETENEEHIYLMFDCNFQLKNLVNKIKYCGPTSLIRISWRNITEDWI
ncbi:hypothetical protein CAPTEDRAFT_206544 [Capitella teleta]|uniref:FH2 domain-containing protein n=1 Tax=Capitella teleta TaxID=283909 RepID=R7UX94_CAPTE|nr:hypothetical protein CAPTEDRAFT_206544 [Capitella teleta]|eukprot:ELU10917.1 hypothetical protein CAPTEDRAFT_206544 [Capitella teleta]